MDFMSYISSYFDHLKDGGSDDSLSRGELSSAIQDGIKNGDLDGDGLKFARYLSKNFDKFDRDGDESLSSRELNRAYNAATKTLGITDGPAASNATRASATVDSPKADASFVSQSAGYSNSVYTYDIDDNGKPVNFRLLIENTHNQDAGMLGEVSMGKDGMPNLLVLSNGASQINADANLTFQDGKVLIDGKAYEGLGYFSHDNTLDQGRVVTGQTESQFKFDKDTGLISIEDLCTTTRGCDKDYNDIVLKITPTDGPSGRRGGPSEPSEPTERTSRRVVVEPTPANRPDFFFNTIEDMSFAMGNVVNGAKAGFDSAILNLEGNAEFSVLLEAQGAAANLTATISAATGALQSVTSATSTSAGKIGQ